MVEFDEAVEEENNSSSPVSPSSGSGWMTVPLPVGFSTFLIRIGIFLRMTYAEVRNRLAELILTVME